MTGQPQARSNSRTVAMLAGVVVLMGALSWAAVPFYNWFCKVTGYGGTTNVSAVASDTVLEETIRVRFDANVDENLGWTFRPMQREMKLKIGENAIAFYEAVNNTDETITGTASYANQGRARTAQRNQGRLCVYADHTSGRLLGAELCAPDGEHLAHPLALAVQQQLTVHDLLGMPFYHPTLEEGLRTALRDAARQLPNARTSDLAACPALGVPALD